MNCSLSSLYTLALEAEEVIHQSGRYSTATPLRLPSPSTKARLLVRLPANAFLKVQLELCLQLPTERSKREQLSAVVYDKRRVPATRSAFEAVYRYMDFRPGTWPDHRLLGCRIRCSRSSNGAAPVFQSQSRGSMVNRRKGLRGPQGVQDHCRH